MTNITYADQKQFARGAQFLEQRYLVEIPNNQGLEDVLRPDYWRTVSDIITRNAVVTVINEANGIDIDLRCTAKGHGYCMMKVIRVAPNEEAIEESSEAQRCIEYRPGFKWCVIGTDKGILESNFETREKAHLRLEEIEEKAAA
jgi:hypothetical protein